MLRIGAAFLLLLSFQLRAQNLKESEAQSLQNKYDYYRLKLTNDFLVVGSNQGESIPLSIRNRWGGNEATWGDATIYLGWYLGVLGTEHQLLSHSENETKLNSNLRELYYAMWALQRLDLIAESHSFTQSTNTQKETLNKGYLETKINGFISRDDVPVNFVTKNAEKLNGNITSEKAISVTKSDWIKNNRNYEMSKDQVIHLLMGLKLVWKFMPDEVVKFKLEGNEMQVNFKSWSKLLALELINYSTNNSKIVNATTGNLVKRGGLTQDIVYPLNQLKQDFELIEQSKFKRIKNKGLEKASFSFLIWTGYKQMCVLKVDNLHMVMTLGSITKDVISRKAISSKAENENWHPFYELLFDVVNDDPKKDYSEALKFLTDAPNFGISHDMLSIKGKKVNSVGWESPHRFIKNYTAQVDGWSPNSTNPTEKMKGYFNGLDFMLLYNLYKIRTQ